MDDKSEFISSVENEQSQHSSVLALAVFVASLLFLLGLVEDAFTTERNSVTFLDTPLEEPSTEYPNASSSLPQKLIIPSLNITAEFETPLGLDSEGAVEVPVAYDTVGWYKYGPTPGEVGPAVIFGHVDTYEGPAVFYSLGQLKEGDEIRVEREDGSTVTFAVQGYERVKQDEFPNDRVYGNLSYPGIRVVTCTGVFDKKSQHYSHNLIVYGKILSVSE